MSRSGVADPFRRTNAAATDNEGWTQTRRPEYRPSTDSLWKSGYSSDDRDLRSEYFGRTPREINDRTPVRGHSMQDPWSRQNRGRSLEVPIEARDGVSRI